MNIRSSDFTGSTCRSQFLFLIELRSTKVFSIKPVLKFKNFNKT
ncbi:hypothetical protein LEP1GSC172_1742 [Leptospira noguchii]|uniref:Uncharacterized protein n=2 Tax=Leptospira noguchii TaxID=28182 RepID=T0H048_9LEPT|nr:hypothetical protein LEP1GSC172_1742 [Leptospira noguchii]EQA72886.1 hypothetical protein LEP1GSC059_3310 [Leptospira noguchii serovar Panama str. CZ214]